LGGAHAIHSFHRKYQIYWSLIGDISYEFINDDGNAADYSYVNIFRYPERSADISKIQIYVFI